MMVVEGPPQLPAYTMPPEQLVVPVLPVPAPVYTSMPSVSVQPLQMCPMQPQMCNMQSDKDEVSVSNS